MPEQTCGAALITGGASGIGLATARQLASRGQRVVILDVDVAAAGRALHAIASEPPAVFVEGDVSRPAQVRDAFRQATAAVGRIELLVNNAGILGVADFIESDDEALQRVLSVNLGGCIWTSREAVVHMRENGGGVILNVASITASIGSPDFPVYAAAKAGLVGLTRSLARRYARHNIRVNCICPGSVRDTNLLTASGLEALSLQERLALTHHIPLARITCPNDVASMVAFLGSPAARAVTGAVLVVDGGESLGL
jgi:NAD(P)-dependent dehydrogenase (short-subunit alcohol dehydrogenase family)